MFHVGQKVVCINDDFEFPENAKYPVKGEVYHIRELVTISSGLNCLRLVEIVNGDKGICARTWEVCEPRFLVSRFRAIVERKTDISCLKALLNPSFKVKETA